MRARKQKKTKVAARGKQKASRPKYNNAKVVIDGHQFASRLEARRYIYLKDQLQSNAISELELQPRYLLQESFRGPEGKLIRSIHYVADFQYFEHRTQRMIVEDVKGWRTDSYKLKRKLFLYKYKNLYFKEIMDPQVTAAELRKFLNETMD